MVNKEQLAKLHIGEQWVDALNATFERFNINTPVRQAAFIGQCGHECGNFRILEENLNYRAEALQKLWPKRFVTNKISRSIAQSLHNLIFVVTSLTHVFFIKGLVFWTNSQFLFQFSVCPYQRVV